MAHGNPRGQNYNGEENMNLTKLWIANFPYEWDESNIINLIHDFTKQEVAIIKLEKDERCKSLGRGIIEIPINFREDMLTACGIEIDGRKLVVRQFNPRNSDYRKHGFRGIAIEHLKNKHKHELSEAVKPSGLSGCQTTIDARLDLMQELIEEFRGL